MLSFYLSLVETQSDKEKVEFIYLNYYKLMSYVINQYVSNKDDVSDLVHDSMVKIIYNIDKVDVNDEFRTRSFCTTVAKHKAIDFLRKKEHHNIPLDENDEFYSLIKGLTSFSPDNRWQYDEVSRWIKGEKVHYSDHESVLGQLKCSSDS